MNERIREIAMSVQRERHWTEEDIEMFGALIVQECYDVVMTGDRYRRDYFADKIKKHFGMEEGMEE